MSYEKKVLLLKQTSPQYSLKDKSVSAILRLECENDSCDLYLSLVDIKAVENGSYFLFFLDGEKRLYSYDLGKRPLSFFKNVLPCPSLAKGLVACVAHVVSELPYQVMSGKTNECSTSISQLSKLVNEKCLLEFKALQKKKEKAQDEKIKPISKIEQGELDDEQDFISFVKTEDSFTPNVRLQEDLTQNATLPTYDDEAVVTENYFDYDKGIQSKLKSIKEWDFETCSDENELPNSSYQEKTQEDTSFSNGAKNENPSSKSQMFADAILGENGDNKSCEKNAFSELNPYYLTVKQEIEDVFSKFPQENCLKSVFPDSRWVKIHYSNDKYYLVGVIKENHKERFICYGVPSIYSDTPPVQLEGYCSFIPLSIYDLHGEGFWMMFQDATTGECFNQNKKN